MSLPRSTCYATPKEPPSDAGLTAEIRAITDEFECYGYRRVGAELRRRGRVVNAKKLRRLMRENELNPRRRRRFTRTTDSGHDGPVFPFVARGLKASGPDQLWVGDITYVAVAQGFVYLSVILDAWSRRVIGHAIARDLEARHSVAALERAIALRRPEGCCTMRGAHWPKPPRAGGFLSANCTSTSRRRSRGMKTILSPLAAAPARPRRSCFPSSMAPSRRRCGQAGRAGHSRLSLERTGQRSNAPHSAVTLPRSA
jgi:transposase InsO family protein